MESELLNSIIKKIFSEKKISNDFLLDFPNLDIFISEAIKQNNYEFLKKAKEKNKYIFNTKDLFLALDFDRFECFTLISKDIDFNEAIIKEICKRKNASTFITRLLSEEIINPYSDTYEEIFYQNNLFEISLFLLNYGKEKLLKRFLKEKKDLFLLQLVEKNYYDKRSKEFLKYLIKKNKRSLLNNLLELWKKDNVGFLFSSLIKSLKYINENNFFMLKDLIDYLTPHIRKDLVLYLEIILSIYLNNIERIKEKISKKLFDKETFITNIRELKYYQKKLTYYQNKLYSKFLLKVFKELEKLNLISFEKEIIELINFRSLNPLLKYSIRKGFNIFVKLNIINKNFSILNYQTMENKKYVEDRIVSFIYDIIRDENISLESIKWIYSFFSNLEILKSGYIIDIAVTTRKDLEIIKFLKEKINISREVLFLCLSRNDEYSKEILDLYKDLYKNELNILRSIYEKGNVEEKIISIKYEDFYYSSTNFKLKEILNLNEEEIKNNKDKDKEGFYLANALLLRNNSIVELIIKKRLYERFNGRIIDYFKKFN